MNLDITSPFPNLEALTPDGRWNMLQDWLAKNPEYAERAERWSTQTVDQVFDELLALSSKKYGPLAVMAFTLPLTAAKIRSAIEVLQAGYRERAVYDNQQLEKEIKNVRATRTVEKRSGKNPRGKTTRTKRTDQA